MKITPIFLFKEEDQSALRAIKKIAKFIDDAAKVDTDTNVVTSILIQLTPDEYYAFIDPKRVTRINNVNT